MAVAISEHLVLSPKEGFGSDLEFYRNVAGEVFVQSLSEEYPQFWFVITKEDWEEIKEFMDEQFKT